MKTLVLLIGIVFVALTYGGSRSFAEYDSEGDINLSFNLLEDNLSFSDDSGEATFQLQEEVHNSLTNYTGAEVDHSYVWININGYKILAIDPPKPCFN